MFKHLIVCVLYTSIKTFINHHYELFFSFTRIKKKIYLGFTMLHYMAILPVFYNTLRRSDIRTYYEPTKTLSN